MLRMLRGGQRWLTLLIVIGVGGVFAVFLGLQGPMEFSSASQVVKVGPHEFGLPEFERVRAQREELLRNQLGDQYDPRALREMLDNMAARELVDRALLALAADEVGLKVSKREVEHLVLADPGFRDGDGRFDREQFEDFAEYAYGSQRAFLQDRRLALLAVKMYRLLNGQPEVSAGEAREALQRELEEVRIATVSVEADAGTEEIEITPETLAAVLEERSEEIAQRYEEQDELYDRPERVRARHILRSLAQDAPDAEVERVRAEIEAAAARIEGGESFESVAAELSQDPGSQSRGGDLGFFGRGQMVPGFEEAAFALEPGRLSEPVRSSFGFHLIRVEEKQEAVSRALEEVREEIAGDLLRREARRERARARADQLAEAVRGGRSLEEAARESGLDVRRSGWLTRRAGGFVPGLGPAPELVSAAFALEPGQSSPRIFEVDERFALLQLLERKQPDPAQIEASLEEKRAALLQAKRQLRTDSWLNERRDALLDSGELVVDLAALRR